MMTVLSLEEKRQQKRLINIWGLTFMIAFPLLIILGLLMRLRQGEITTTAHNDFYTYMTLHGLGMISILFSFAFAGIWYLLSTRYVKLNNKLGCFIYVVILLGVIALTIGTLIGKFGPGWYLLYPLPFVGTFWQTWATTVSTIAIIVIGIAWLIGILHVLYAMAKKYGGFTNILGWEYLRKKQVEKDMPPVIMIATIALLPGVFAIIAGAIFLILFIIQIFEPSLSFDSMSMKNLVMFFGHTIANITMYCAVGWVYLLLPEYTGRKIKMNKVLVYSWNATFFFITLAFFHHMYMDFVQSFHYQVIGQIISYSSAVPATGITMFTVISQIYHSRIKWGIVPLMFLLGMAGWAIGGVSAIVDSTIAFNTVFHNTLWVPAHFHTYMLMGVIPFILGFLYYISSIKENADGGILAKLGFWIFTIGSYGFLLMFYLGGLESVPRRYSSYDMIGKSGLEKVSSTGSYLAGIAVVFVGLVLLGLLIMYITLFSRMIKKKGRVEDFTFLPSEKV